MTAITKILTTVLPIFPMSLKKCFLLSINNINDNARIKAITTAEAQI